jgi:hypothetical protein
MPKPHCHPSRTKRFDQQPLFAPRMQAPTWQGLPPETTKEIVRPMAGLMFQLRQVRSNARRENGDE